MAEQAAAPIELTLGDGTVVKAANIEEGFKVLAKMKEDTAAALREAKAQATQFQSERDQYAQQLETTRQERERATISSGGYSKEQYYKLLNEDPMVAADYLDAYRYDLPQEQVRQTFIGVRERVDQLVYQSVTGSFLAQHAEDYPQGDPIAAKALVGRMQQLVTNGLPVNVDTMNYAYTQLVGDGTIKPMEAVKDETPDAPPSLSGPGNVLSDSEAVKAEQMNDKELAALLRSKGMLV